MFRRIMAFGLFCLLVVLAVSCDDDCPTCPPPPTDPVSDYDVYLAGFSGRPLYVYNTKETNVVDSLQLGEIPGLTDIALSGNGRHLLMAIWNDTNNGIQVLDLADGSTVTSMDFGMSIEVSNEGKYIAVNDPTRLYFLDGMTYEILYSDSINNLFAGRFLNDDRKFYCVDDDYYIHIYDMATMTIDTTFRYYDSDSISPAIYQIQPEATGNKIYFTCWYPPYLHYLKAYSIEDDSTIFELAIAPPTNSDLRLTPDGSQIIYTDAGDVMIELYGTMHVIYINPESDAIISIVDAGHSIRSDLGFIPGVLAITPDSRYSIVTCAGGCPVFGTIDNIQHKFVDIYYDLSMPQTKSFVYVACQKSP